MPRTLALLALSAAHLASGVATSSLELYDSSRGRRIPLALYEPATETCTVNCKVVIFGTGYRATPSDYGFLLEALAQLGYFAVALQHDLPEDTPMPDTGDIATDRGPYWEKGGESIMFVAQELSSRFPKHDWSSLTQIGHSNGGDIAALYTSRHPDRVRELITLDNRRVPLPFSSSFRVLSLRSSDQQPDSGVLPTKQNAQEGGACIIKMKTTRHDDMNRAGSSASKASIIGALTNFLVHKSCASDA